MSEEGEGRKSGKGYSVKIYTIRGLDPELYGKFSRIAKEIGKNVGELMNEAMKTLITAVEIGKEVGKAGIKATVTTVREASEAVKEAANVEVISGVEELEVGKEDLEALQKPAIFTGMRRLEFSDNVSWDLINEKVKAIKLVDEVVVPKHIPRILIAKKCSLVKRIRVREA